MNKQQTNKFYEILNRVEKPARYVGGEYNTPKLLNKCDVRMCYCMPDVYEVAMSNLGIKILYDIFNQHKGFVAERCFAPWPDMGKELVKNNLPLFSLETRTFLKDFDMVGFSLQYEMSYTNVLYMLDLAQIPFKSKDRKSLSPIIMVGGPCAVNVEPMSEFIDFAVVGDGEDANIQAAEIYCQCKKEGRTKQEFLERVSKVRGVYVPSLVKVKQDGRTIKSIDGPKTVKAIVKDLNTAHYPTKPLVPNIEIVHDRAVLEIFRGCTRGCRFCQAGYIYRPVRNRSQEKLCALAKELIDNTGYEELSLNSLSTGDYPNLVGLIDGIQKSVGKKVYMALPSLRLDSFEGEISDNSRKSSLTFAPEAGTQRLRDVINKNITEENIVESMKKAFKHGYSNVKLYFMIGLPTETDEDLMGIVDVAKKVKWLYRENRTSGKALTVTVSTSTFIPKPFTPFQWCEQISIEETERKQKLLKEELKKIGVHYIYHDSTVSEIEGVFARGDRRLNNVLLSAYKKGCMFDGWNEHFLYDKWLEALQDNNLTVQEYNASIKEDALLPWSMISIGVNDAYLKREWEKAKRGETTPDCRQGCTGCGLRRLEVCQ